MGDHLPRQPGQGGQISQSSQRQGLGGERQRAGSGLGRASREGERWQPVPAVPRPWGRAGLVSPCAKRRGGSCQMLGLWLPPSLPSGCRQRSGGDGVNNRCTLCRRPRPWRPALPRGGAQRTGHATSPCRGTGWLRHGSRESRGSALGGQCRGTSSELLSQGSFFTLLWLSQRFGYTPPERGAGDGSVGCSLRLRVLLWDVSSFHLPFSFWRNRRHGRTCGGSRNGRLGGCLPSSESH